MITKVSVLFAGIMLIAAPAWASGQQQNMEEMFKEYMEKYATPGEHHKHLERLAGKWKTTGKFWMAPDAQAIESTGTAEHKMVLEGRFLQTSYQGEFFGMPFLGLGTQGFDRYTNKYVETWMDSMGTMTMISEGACEQEGKVRTITAEFDDPMTKKRTKIRSVYRIADADHYVLEAYGLAPNGSEFKMMEINHTRSQ